MRSGKPGESWKEVGQSDGPKRFFSKKDLVKGEKYQFRVRAVNKAGPSDPSEPSQLMVCKARKREELQDHEYWRFQRDFTPEMELFCILF